MNIIILEFLEVEENNSNRSIDITYMMFTSRDFIFW